MEFSYKYYYLKYWPITLLHLSHLWESKRNHANDPRERQVLVKLSDSERSWSCQLPFYRISYEIQRSLLHRRSNKTLSIVLITGENLKCAWNFIGSILLVIINDALRIGCFSNCWNTATVVSIPKATTLLPASKKSRRKLSSCVQPRKFIHRSSVRYHRGKMN